MTTSGKGPKHITGALRDAGGRAGSLYARADALRARERALLGELPAGADGHVRLARLDRDEMLLVTDGPEWRHRLRYLARQLQEVVRRQEGFCPQRVTVRVGELPRRPAPTAPRALSPAAARVLASAAAHTRDPALAAALARLASRGEEPEDGGVS